MQGGDFHADMEYKVRRVKEYPGSGTACAKAWRVRGYGPAG